MTISTQPPTGFRDFFGETADRRQSVIESIQKTYQSFGFSLLETPALERLEILQGSGGGENEKLIFKVMKRGDKLESALKASPTEDSIADFGMRFDLTVPLSRVVSEYRGEIAFPFKACHIGPVWRAERAQKGRFREFIQADADIVGSRSWAADVEVLQAGVTAVAAVGGDGFRLKINHRAWLRAALLAEGVAEENHQSFLIVLDKKDKQDLSELRKELEAISGKPLSSTMQKILEGELSLNEALSVDATSGQELKNILESLQALDLQLKTIEFDPSLARGLGYYTGSIFELRHESESFSFGGGGRYDQLIGRFSKESLPAVGFSIGFDRLMLLLSKQSQESKVYQERSVFIPIFSDELRPAILQMAKRLRNTGLRVDVYPEAAKLKNQFKFADARSYRWCLIVGEDEMKSGELKLKDMKTTQERSLRESEISKSILEHTNAV